MVEIFLNRIGRWADSSPVASLVFDTNFFNRLRPHIPAYTDHKGSLHPVVSAGATHANLALYVISYNQ